MSDNSVSTIPQHKPPIVVLRERLLARRDELKDALTDIDPDHFIRTLITAAQINPELQACTFQSLWLATLKACRDNLLPDGREGAIVGFKSNAQWIPMYQGLLKRFRASGQCKWITADVQRKGEVWEHWVSNLGEHFRHVPGNDEQAPIERVYALALTRDGGFYVVVLTISEINRIRATSKATRDDSPWKLWPGEMMKKTALRRLSKLLPSGRDLFEEEDDDSIPAEQPVAAEERSPGAAAALETFAGRIHAPAPSASEGEPGGEESNTPAAPAACNQALIADHFIIAYERGQIAKATGSQRRAIPGEYRDEANAREAEAWHAGYDGKPWVNPETGETLGESDVQGPA